MDKNRAYLEHILEAITKIEKYIKGNDYGSFLKNEILQDALIRQIEIIGEAANRLSDEFLKGYSNISWKDIVGMRNRLIHDYFELDLDQIWKVAKEDIPVLKKSLES